MHTEQYEESHTRRHGGPGRGRGTPLSELDPELTDVSRRVIGCAIEIHKTLGPGYDASVYRKALCVELEEEGITFESPTSANVQYRDQDVGVCEGDLRVDDRFMVNVLAERREVGGAERSSLRALLRAADMELGLIINFGERRLKDGLVRVLNPDKLAPRAPGRDADIEGEHAHERNGEMPGYDQHD